MSWPPGWSSPSINIPLAMPFLHMYLQATKAWPLRGISVVPLLCMASLFLRFDFTGLGESEGDFSDTTFTSNVNDLLAAAQYLEAHYEAPSILVGHSLGGAAVIFAANQLPSVNAIATIGAPSEPEHVSHLLQDNLEQIEQFGKAKVDIGGRVFTIKKEFLDDLQGEEDVSHFASIEKTAPGVTLSTRSGCRD